MCNIGFAVFPSLILSGLFLNIVQLFAYCLIRPISEKLFRKVNHNLQFLYWSQAVATVDWYSNLKCHVTLKDEETKREFGKHSGLVISNHSYDVDWLAAWMFSDKLGNLGSDKAMLKSSLKYVPVIGWGFALNDMMFVSRNWNKDRESIAKSMDRLLTYERSLFLAFFEGTRFTEAKHAASIKFAEERNISIRLKHHLLPRVRGFQVLLQRIKEGLKKNPELSYGIYNFQLAIKSDGPVSMTRLLSKQPAEMFIYVEKLNIDEMPDEEEAITDYMYKLYQRKDELQEQFNQTGQFPGIKYDYKPRVITLINWIFWMLVVYGGFFYYIVIVLHQGLTNEFTTSGLVFLGLVSLFSVTVIIIIKVWIGSTKISKSSAYGASTDKKSK